MRLFILVLVCLSCFCIETQAAGCSGGARIGRVRERISSSGRIRIIPRLRK